MMKLISDLDKTIFVQIFKFSADSSIRLLLLMFFISCVETNSDSPGENITNTGENNQFSIPAPNSIQLLIPSTNPDFQDRPTFRVGGVQLGHAVSIFSNQDCTTLVATGNSNGNTIDLQVNSLSFGSTGLYAKTVDSESRSSSCSGMLATYTRTLCPNGYIEIPANNNIGVTSNFCVMKYEAKCSTTKEGIELCPTPSGAPTVSKVAVSIQLGSPWTAISALDALSACKNLNGLYQLSNKFDLISNSEWMTIARNIENVSSNWTLSSGTLKLNRGHSDNNPNTSCNGLVENVTNNCSTQDGTPSNFHQKRTFTLSTNEIIWDIAGNTWEWIDWEKETPNTNFTRGPQTCFYDGNVGWEQIQNKISTCDPELGETNGPYLASPQDTSLSSSNNIGLIQGGHGEAITRGGKFSDGIVSGIYSMNLYNEDTEEDSSVGFRCVYRP
jgi:hypothetical protein